jgi:hypothetical protein
MKRAFIFTLVLALCGAFFPTQSLAAAKAGAPCKKAKLMSVSGGKLYTCVKSGKKLVWNKGEVISKTLSYDSAPTTPRTGVKKTDEESPSQLADKWSIPTKLPSSFDDLYENRAGISYAVWKKTSADIKSNVANVPPLEILVGPNTSPWSKNHEEVISLVSRIFTKQINPKKLYVVFHSYTDMAWADTKVKEFLPSDEYSEWVRNEGGISGNCQTDLRDCLGAKIKTSRNNQVSFLLIGVSNQVGMLEINGSKYGNVGVTEQNKKGMLVAHEFIHTLQSGPMAIAQTLELANRPPAWIWEGSATLFQNLAVNSDSYQNYMNYRKDSLGELIERQGIQEDFINNYLKQKNWIEDPYRGGQSPDWSYQLGARVMEILVALKGSDSTLEIFNLMSQKKSFESSFKTAFGITYEDAVPVIAKTLAANWKAGL